jgi:hypothetical protein
MNNELENMLNKPVMTHFMVLSQNFPGSAEENQEKPTVRTESLWA